MGTSLNITNCRFYYDGKPIELANIQSVTLDPLPDDETPVIKNFESEVTITCTLRHKNMYRMSRKRFIKLLMGTGLSRNVANKFARIVQKTGIPYKSLWIEMMFL